MSAGLQLLLTLQGKALLRRMFRGMKGPKGIFLFIFGIIVMAAWLAPAVIGAKLTGKTPPHKVQTVAPLIMLASCILTLISSGGEKAIVFTPAEVDFLFPAPFTRRQLLIYKMIKMFAGGLFSALILGTVLIAHAANWFQAFLGTLTTIMFLQLLGVAIALTAQSAGERAYSLTRKVILGLIIAIIAMAILPSIIKGGRLGFNEAAGQLRAGRAGAILLAPFEVFTHIFTARRWWPEVIGYLGLAVTMMVGMVWIVLRLDADYLEAAAARSQVVHEKLQRARERGIMTGKFKAGRTLGDLPHLRGAGPLAWRQLTTALRNSKGMLFLLLILGISVGPIVIGGRKDMDALKFANTVIGVMAWITIIAGSWLKFDYRGDLDQMDHLKSLPASSVAISAGQLIAPTLVMSLAHLLIVISIFAVTRRQNALLVAAIALSLPFNWILCSIENLIFLWFPTRQAVSPADFQGFGRQVLIFIAKGVLVVIAMGIAAIPTTLVQLLTGSLFASVATAGVMLCGVGVGILFLVALAFRRFDVARDVPT